MITTFNPFLRPPSKSLYSKAKKHLNIIMLSYQYYNVVIDYVTSWIRTRIAATTVSTAQTLRTFNSNASATIKAFLITSGLSSGVKSSVSSWSVLFQYFLSL